MNALDSLNNEYFEWMFDLVCGERFPDQLSYRKLLMKLHEIEFVYLIDRDSNRASDGIDLRYRFVMERGCRSLLEYLEGPCSVLEMMVALSIRCEENIMDDPRIGNRTGQWFWGMIVNLGLGSMSDSRYDRRYVEDIAARFLNREYEPNGKGGLFTVRKCNCDLREFEIWKQMNWYLNTIV